MTTQAGDVVAQYYAAFDSHRDGWQDLVTDDVLFDGPVQHARGKADFVTLTVPGRANVYAGGRMNVVGGGQKWQSPVAS